MEAAGLIRDGELRAAEVVSSCLERIQEREATVGAWAWIDPDHALEQARERDAQPPRGPLHGVPVAVKDIIDTADAPTTYGSVLYDGHRPATDAVCVRLLREAGAVVLGKTVTTEFAMFAPGRTANPVDPRRTPGGSSSGSAAAVADRMVPLALGTQTAGSIVRPASFCGVFGLKPTYGSFSVAGVKAVSPSLDTLGHFARTVEDLTVLADVLAARAARARPQVGSDDGTIRVGFTRTAQWPRAEEGARARIEQAVERLSAHTPVEEVVLPDDFAGLVAAQDIIMKREAVGALGDERRRGADRLSAKLLDVLAEGDRIDDDEYESAQSLAKRCRRQLDGVLAGCDVLLAPAVLGEAPLGLEATGDPLFCRAWTLLGTPTVAVPGLVGPAGLPLGVQVIARPGRDDTALAAARWIAGHLPTDDRSTASVTSRNPGTDA